MPSRRGTSASVPAGADAGARHQVDEFLQTPVFHSYRPGVLLHNWWMRDARKNNPWCLARQQGDLCTMNNIMYQNPGQSTVDVCSRRYNKYKNGHGTCCVFPRDPTGADKDLDMVTGYDEYHNQRVLCERDWPVQRKYNATKKAFNPEKMYPPIDRPPTNYGLTQLKQKQWDNQRKDADPNDGDYNTTYTKSYLEQFVPPPDCILLRDCEARVNKLPESTFAADCHKTPGSLQSMHNSEIMAPCQTKAGMNCAYTHRDFRLDMAKCTDTEKPKGAPASCVGGPLHPQCDPCQGNMFRRPVYGKTENQQIQILPLMGPGEEKPGPRTHFHVEHEDRTVYPPYPKQLPEHICAGCS